MTTRIDHSNLKHTHFYQTGESRQSQNPTTQEKVSSLYKKKGHSESIITAGPSKSDDRYYKCIESCDKSDSDLKTICYVLCWLGNMLIK